MIDDAMAALRKVADREKVQLDTDPESIPVTIRKWRKRGLIKPADLTELRLAYQRYRGASEFRKHYAKAVAETLLDREIRKDTPQ